MDKPKTTGVQHVGLGVRDLEKSRVFYRDVLQCTKVYADFGKIWNVMPDFFRSSPHVLDGFMYRQEEGGIIVEPVQRLDPPPRPIHKQIFFGDIGVNKMTVEVSDAEKFYREYQGKLKFLTKPQSTNIPGWGDYSFVFGADPDGNLIEFVSSSKIKVPNTLGKIRSLGVSVTELERSMAFYQKYVDYDTVVIKPHDSFSGLVGEVSGSATTEVKSCLLANSNGYHMLELYEVSKPRGRSIPLHALWADYGYLEVAHTCGDILTLANYYTSEGLEFDCAPSPIAVESELYSGTIWFMYIRDPDGIPVEFIME